tara:strand:+ start:4978 stop:5787 length:810 start_codon:yes stop_codon:yes gene_type:complete
MTKIIQISDPHIVPNGQLAYNRVDTAAPLALCVETVNRLLPEIGPIDMAFVAGDLTDFGTKEEYDRFRMIMDPLKIPYQAIPGNHDNKEAMRLAFSDQAWMPCSGAINWMTELVDFAIIGLDTSVMGAPHGHLTEATLDYLQVKLTEVSPKPVIVAVHHPPVTTGIEKMDIQNLRDSETFERILSRYQAELRLVCGHIHRNVVTKFGDVICQIGPGTSHAVTLDQRKAAPNCLTREPGAFLLHEWRNGLMTHSIPIGQFDGPWMFYPDL